ncbi:MAG TPA: SDR family oxidoreductase [Beutenbergiaceae bacterium]|nr:SDR family oxidoreductase [Beutenbergiaceae bacterium]
MGTGTALPGARVLITGAASGIGRQLALDVAERGGHVIAWDIDAEGVASLCGEIQDTGATAQFAVVDVTSPEAVQASTGEAGRVDVLINNAGVVTGEPLLAATDGEIRGTFDVNVLSLYWVTRAFLGQMIERGTGTVVTMASAAGLVGIARQSDYSPSKWAAVGFDEALRAELRTEGHQVRTLVVCPYYVDTGMFDGARSRYPRLMPILRTAEVSRRTLNALESGRRRLFLPATTRMLPVLRALPTGLFDRAMDLLGVNESMATFTGRGRTAGRAGKPAG